MKQIKIFFTLIALIFVCESTANAEDTYNFFFQKAPGSTEVTQGDEKGQTVQVKSDGENTESAEQPYVSSDDDFADDEDHNLIRVRAKADNPRHRTHTTRVRIANKRKRRWSASLGVGALVRPDYAGRQGFGGWDQHLETTVVGMNFQVSKYFDLDASLQFVSGESEGGVPGQFTPGTQWALGAGVTPFHIRIFGAEVFSIGFVGGFMSIDKYSEESNFFCDSFFNGSTCSSDVTVESSVERYLGPKIGIRFSDSLQVLGVYKRSLTDKDYAQTSFSLVYSW